MTDDTYYQLTSAQDYGFGGYNNVNVRVIEETEDQIHGVVVGEGNSVSEDGDREITVTKNNIAAWKEVEPVDLQAAVERAAERNEEYDQPDGVSSVGSSTSRYSAVDVAVSVVCIGIVPASAYIAAPAAGFVLFVLGTCMVAALLTTKATRGDPQ